MVRQEHRAAEVARSKKTVRRRVSFVVPALPRNRLAEVGARRLHASGVVPARAGQEALRLSQGLL